MSSNNPFIYDITADTLVSPYPYPTNQQYECSFSGSGTLEEFSIEGSKLCMYTPDVSWSGGKSKCSWQKSKKSWSKKLICDWKTLTVTYKDNWCCCWKSPDIVVLPTTSIEMTMKTNININQIDSSYRLTTNPPSSNVKLKNYIISVCDYTNTQTITDPSGVVYTDVPCMTLYLKTDGKSEDPIYIPQKTFVVSNGSGQFPRKINIIPDTKTVTKSNGFKYETHIIIDMIIDKTNTTSWIYYKATVTLYIYDDTTGTKLDTTSTTFNMNLKSINLKV
jgi:hypothetical protein